MAKRMRMATPAIYEVLDEDRTVPEEQWGWVELADIARITGLSAFHILVRFLEFGTAPVKIRGSAVKLFHYLRTPCGVPDEFDLRVLITRDFDIAYEDCRCGGELREVGLNRFVENHSIRVPARWGKEVLTELKTNPITMP